MFNISCKGCDKNFDYLDLNAHNGLCNTCNKLFKKFLKLNLMDKKSKKNLADGYDEEINLTNCENLNEYQDDYQDDYQNNYNENNYNDQDNILENIKYAYNTGSSESLRANHLRKLRSKPSPSNMISAFVLAFIIFALQLNLYHAQSKSFFDFLFICFIKNYFLDI